MAPSDTPDLFALTDRGRAHLRHWLPWVDAVRAPSHSRAFIRAQRNLRQQGIAQTWGIFEVGRLTGVISLHEMNWADRNVSIGYWLGARYEGRGLMTRAVEALVSYLVDYLGFHRVTIHCAVGNHRSRAIPERLGFRKEGVLHGAGWLYDHYVDLVVYAKILRA